MGKLCQFLTELSASDTSIYLFSDNNFSKYQYQTCCALILQRSALGMLMAKFHQFLTVICLGYDSGRVLSFHIFICGQAEAFEGLALQTSGPSCSKLTMSLVNESLKFTSSDTQIC